MKKEYDSSHGSCEPTLFKNIKKSKNYLRWRNVRRIFTFWENNPRVVVQSMTCFGWAYFLVDTTWRWLGAAPITIYRPEVKRYRRSRTADAFIYVRTSGLRSTGAAAAPIAVRNGGVCFRIWSTRRERRVGAAGSRSQVAGRRCARRSDNWRIRCVGGRYRYRNGRPTKSKERMISAFRSRRPAAS